MTDTTRSREEFETALRDIGKSRYHDLHPFHHLLHGGELNQGQVQAWALNRYYYQISIPRKDLTLMSRIEDPRITRNLAASRAGSRWRW